MTPKKYILITIIWVAIIIGYISYLVSKPDTIAIHDRFPEISTNSRELVASFIDNESKANTIYLNKIIDVKGTIKEINYLNDRSTILLSSDYKNDYVICDMNPEQVKKMKDLRVGQKISVRGICKGFLKDVILLNCILINQKL